MTEEDVFELFESLIKPSVVIQFGRGRGAVREAFHDWTKLLCRGGEISNTMLETIHNPY